MAKRMTVFKDVRHNKATQLSNSTAEGGAVSIKGEVQTVSAMMPIHRCLEMTLLACK